MSNHFDNERWVDDTGKRSDPAREPLAFSAKAQAGLPEGEHMSEVRKPSSTLSNANARVDALAARVLALVAAGAQKGSRALRADFLNELVSVCQVFEEEKRLELVAEMRKAGISDAKIVDRYIPEAARVLGDLWTEDRLGFAEVTIGTARLQGLLREFEPEELASPRAPSVIVIVPEGTYHTLGAMVVTNQLRNQGMSVKQSIGHTSLELRKILSHNDFDMVIISATAREKLENIRSLVKNIRQSMMRPTPIVVGGGVLDQETDVKTLSGADYISNSTTEAVELCGLKIRKRVSVRNEHRS